MEHSLGNIFQLEKRNDFLYPSGHFMFYCFFITPMKYPTVSNNCNYFCCRRSDVSCNHSSGDLFMCEDDMLLWHVEISHFQLKAHLVFHWCSYKQLVFYGSAVMKYYFSSRLWICIQPGIFVLNHHPITFFSFANLWWKVGLIFLYRWPHFSCQWPKLRKGHSWACSKHS